MWEKREKSLSRVRLFVTPWTVAYQAPLSMGFSKQEYWSGLPFPSPGDLPDPDTKPGSSALRHTLYPLSHQGSPELGYKESWALKNWCFGTVVLEKTLESPLDCKEIQPVNSKGNQTWIFTGRTDAEAETPILWSPDAKNWVIGKDPGTGKDWRQEEKGTTEDEMVGWHHRLDGHEFEQALGFGDGQGSLACCSPWDSKESDMTEQLNWTETNCKVKEKASYLHLNRNMYII